MRRVSRTNESCRGHTHTHSTQTITRTLSFFPVVLSLSLSLTHTDIGEGVQGSRHVATPDCHIQNNHDAGAASRTEAADWSIGGIAPVDCSVARKSRIRIMGLNIV